MVPEGHHVGTLAFTIPVDVTLRIGWHDREDGPYQKGWGVVRWDRRDRACRFRVIKHHCYLLVSIIFDSGEWVGRAFFCGGALSLTEQHQDMFLGSAHRDTRSAGLVGRDSPCAITPGRA